MKTVDLNCDLGESFGAYRLGRDEEILPLITSANIACGFHAGDPGTMSRTVKLALEHQVAIGAHPGLQDLIGFGRREIKLSPREAYELTIYQVGALWGFVRAEGAVLQHVKPHGALYNMAAVSAGLAEAIAEAVYRIDPELILVGLAGSELIRAAKKTGLQSASEVFADRTYQRDGSLTPRSEPGVLITDEQQSLQQVLQMVTEGKVHTTRGENIDIFAETICLHGDSPHAVEFASSIRSVLETEGVAVQSLSQTAKRLS
ncbi:LamB/YcsF family protein [Paenibacillus tianjinensis]|uniref:5-oxoprolinase subunit A n=1 Tax=Paenibacillus tianjinensis TaxID=2810347 RepID=A0ABX7LFV8_9BACL|nr:5-oxoprolinase subunit PxpA [Paenibacillus tianjinensis]QSF46980.1 LamB/YcsF family protein [Paenibacillus tianjinensis]